MRLRQQAVAIFRAALAAADPVHAILRHRRVLERFKPDGFDSIYVVGAGKASAAMASAVERILGARICGGLINVKDGHLAHLRRIELNECSHPVPDERGVRGAERIAEIVRSAGKRDLVVCVFSGGASALMPMPAAPIALAQMQDTTRLLLACGANIHEINAVRKHISAIQGGQLARMASPATVVSLLLSDVIGDDLGVIGSGPTAPDSSTFVSAQAILEKYGLLARVPAAVRDRIEQGVRSEIPETPKEDDPAFKKVTNVVVGSNRLAVDAAARKARELGFRPLVLSTTIEGETRDVARMHAAIAREVRASGRPVKAPVCLISGGETTVTLRSTGKGGRNQEFALAAAIDLAGCENALVLSGGTDGTDGPTDAAGAIANGATLQRAATLGLDAHRHLANNDSYNFFEPLGDLLKTGPTNTNVMDVRLVLVS